MRKFVVVFAMVGLLLAMTAGSVSATVHPLVCSELSAAAADGTPADTQDPPGITPGGPDSSSATVAQPVVAVITAATGGAESLEAFKAPGC